MKGLITAFFLLLGICPATEVAAQRDLHRQLSLHMQAGTVDGLSVCSRYGEYAWGTAIALERTNRNRTHWKFGVEYLHRDFSPRFREGQDKARELGLYMQNYCGCVFSEEDRYRKRKKKKKPDDAQT